MAAMGNATRRRTSQEFHTVKGDSWNFVTLDVHLSARIDELEKLLLERYETQSKAIDAAKTAQETAMQTALTAAERAVNTARISDKEAVDKAELAADKRFADFRTEVNGAEGRTTQRISDLTSRLDVSAGNGNGREVASANSRANAMQTIALVGLFGGVITAVVLKALGG